MSKTSLWISSLSAAALIGALTYWFTAGGDTTLNPASPEKPAEEKSPVAIADHWQWDKLIQADPTITPPAESENDEVDEPEAEDTEEEVPFDVVVIYDILQDLKLDENGRLVPDQAAKYALDRGFDDLGPNVSPEAIAELHELIRIALPGEVGEEAIRIMTAYHEYRRAEDEFGQLAAADLEGQSDIAAASAEQYEKLVQLRRRYLGNEMADGLFAAEELQARHMFSIVALQEDGDLSDEEKQAQMESLYSSLNARLLALGELTPDEVAAQEVERLREKGASSAEIYAARQALLGSTKAQELAAADREEEQWHKHFEGFWEMRQNIMKASLDDAERERQIEQLLGQYFNPDEQERARFTSMQWQSRERQ